jgi:AmiR/NasT family two-component response regulator
MEKINPDVILMEIADGILQRETHMILADKSIKKTIKGILLTAENAPSALYAVDLLQKLGYKIIAVSGAITSSPLSIREFQEHSQIPVASSADSGIELLDIITKFIEPIAYTAS